MSEPGVESQQDRFYRIKNQGIQVFDKEMRNHNLPEKVIAALHKHCDEYWGCVPIQEQMMEILMDEDLAKFSLKEANDARKIVAKKQMSRIPELREKFYSRFDNKNTADYVWDTCIAPSLGYSFSLNHSLPYTFVGIQCIYTTILFPEVYWNTSCLIVNSGAKDENDDGSTNYGKLARAIGDIRGRGINVTLPDINLSPFGFKPDEENNRILFGLKAMNKVGADVVNQIIANRPYNSSSDLLSKTKINRQVVVSLIKGGALDSFEDRRKIMAQYLYHTMKKKNKLTMTQFNDIIKRKMYPNELSRAKSIYEFNRYLKAKCLSPNGGFKFDVRARSFFINTFNLAIDTIDEKSWKKIYDKEMAPVKAWMKDNEISLLYELNKAIFQEEWEKYAQGTISKWEMDSLCFYYHEHDLADIKTEKYGVEDFFKLSEEPDIDYFFKKNNREIPVFNLHRICGTCIDKNKVKSTVTLLTTTGVVEVKFRKEHFALFDKQISTKMPDGSKKVLEKSWFTRGEMILVQGIRNGDTFIVKKYANKGLPHQLYKISNVNHKDHTMELVYERAKGDMEDAE